MFKWLRREQGQSYLELALLFPFLVLLIMGTLDVGRAMNAYIVVMDAAREGARYGMSHPTETANIQAKAVQETQSSGIALTAANVAVTYPAGTSTTGNPIRVTVTHTFQPIVGAILGVANIPVIAAAEMRISQ